VIEARVRAGEDPLDVIAELPAVDDDVVRILRDEALEAEGLEAQYTLARLIGQDPSRDDAHYYRARANDIDARIYRQIGIEHPSLTRAAWRALGTVEP